MKATKIAATLGERIYREVIAIDGSTDDVVALVATPSHNKGYKRFLKQIAFSIKKEAAYQRRMRCLAAGELIVMLEDYRRSPTNNQRAVDDKIETLDLSTRLYEALMWLDIKTVGELKHVHNHIQESTQRGNSIPRLGKSLRAELRAIVQNL